MTKREFLTKLAKSKTIALSVITVAFGVLEVNQAQLQVILSPEHYGYAVIAIGIVGGVIRMFTTKPIQEK
jgi:hypothetical protein